MFPMRRSSHCKHFQIRLLLISTDIGQYFAVYIKSRRESLAGFLNHLYHKFPILRNIAFFKRNAVFQKQAQHLGAPSAICFCVNNNIHAPLPRPSLCRDYIGLALVYYFFNFLKSKKSFALKENKAAAWWPPPPYFCAIFATSTFPSKQTNTTILPPLREI